MEIGGAVGTALVDLESKVCLGARGGEGLDMELAGAALVEVIQAKKSMIETVGIGAPVEELMFTLNDQNHLVQSFDDRQALFSYLILDQDVGSLALARTELRDIAEEEAIDLSEIKKNPV
jgi:hypothetical protein